MIKSARLLATIAAFAGVPIISAHAGTLASAPLYGGSGQATATCYLVNAGTGAATVTSVSILTSGNSTSLTLSSNTCGTSLAANAGCKWTVAASDGIGYICRAVVAPLAPLRGTAQLVDGSGNPLIAVPLQ